MKSRQVILYLRLEEKLTYGQIFLKTGVSKGRAHEWVTQYQKEGKMENKHLGRPKGTPEKVTLQVIKLVETFMKAKERRGIRPCVTHLKNKNNIDIHRSTVQRILKHKLKLYPYRKKKRTKLTDKHKEHRLEVAKDFLEFEEEWGENLWIDMAFSDECRFNSEPKPNSKNDVVWDDQPDDQKHYSERSKYAGQSVEVWGCITRFGKPQLIEIKRPIITVNGERQKKKFKSGDYIEKILEPTIPKLRKMYRDNGVADEWWTFQQDGDSKHTSKMTQSWLETNVQSYISKSEWPANSPDLSIIENCWSVIWEELKKHKIGSRRRLLFLVKKAWREKITPEYIEKLSNSIPNRMREVVRLGGGATRY